MPSTYRKVSIVIPAYNERRTLAQVVERAKKADTLGLGREIILVDNFSTDGTRDIMKGLAAQDPMVRIILHDKNEGVGKSWRDGMAASTGDIIIRQDADTEYQPEDFPILLKPILEGRAKIVYGSRILGFNKSQYRYQVYLLGGKFINRLVNIMIGTNLTDMLTASKVFAREILDHFSLESAHFEIESELTAKASRTGFTIIEVPITYRARSFEEGKTIRWHHAFRILWAALKYRFAPLK